jgi:lipid A 3-O-deacylase
MKRGIAGLLIVAATVSALAPVAAKADSSVLAIAVASVAIIGGGAIAEAAGSPSIHVGADGRPLPLLGTIGAGYYDVIPDNEGDDGAGLGRLELRFDQEFFYIRPFIGVEATTSGSVYGYAGGMVDVYLGDNFVLSPNIAVGAYEPGDARDLGSTLEFRSGVEAAYQTDGGVRVGVAFYHISNAGIGDENPGIETLTLNVSIPLN